MTTTSARQLCTDQCGVNNYKMTLPYKDRAIQDNINKLCEACREADIEVVEELLSNKKVDINGCDYVGYTPLIRAVRHGHLDIVTRLLQHSEVDVNGAGCRGNTPLISAVWGGHLDIVARLLEASKTQLDKCNNAGQTALHWATLFNNKRVPIMKLLCQDSRCSPVVVNKKDRAGNTALLLAVQLGHLDVVKELDLEGTDFSIKYMDGTTLIQNARRRNRVGVGVPDRQTQG